MTSNQLTRERLEKIKSWRETYGAGSNVMLPAEEAEELARIALTAMDSEPVVFTDERNLHHIVMGRETSLIWGKQNQEAGDIPLYRHAQHPVVRPAPECQHQWRYGGANKLQNQKQCIKCGRVELDAQPAPVVLKDHQIRELVNQLRDIAIKYHAAGQLREQIARAVRSSMLQPEPVTTANKLPFEQWLSQQAGTIDVECGCVMTEVFFHWLRVAYEAGNSPVIPDGYVMVPKEMTDEIGEAIAMQANCCGGIALDIYDAMLSAAPQEVK